MIFLVNVSLHLLAALWKAGRVLLRVRRWKNKLKHRLNRKKECAKPMKKSCLIAIIAALAAVAGALAAVAVYLHRREKELDEYERLLFGEDEAEATEAEPAAEAEEAPASAEEAAPAEQAAADDAAAE